MLLLSGDQKGYASYVASVIGLDVNELIGLIHSFSVPVESAPTNEMYWPSGEIVRLLPA